MIFTEVPKPLGVMFNLDIKKFLPFLSGREFPRGNYLLQDIVSSPGGEFDNPSSRFLVERVLKPSQTFSWSINTSQTRSLSRPLQKPGKGSLQKYQQILFDIGESSLEEIFIPELPEEKILHPFIGEECLNPRGSLQENQLGGEIVFKSSQDFSGGVLNPRKPINTFQTGSPSRPLQKPGKEPLPRGKYSLRFSRYLLENQQINLDLIGDSFPPGII